MRLNFTLPFPPSVNTYWRSVNGRNILSAKGRKFQKDALVIIGILRTVGKIEPDAITGDVGVTLCFVFPDHRKRDLDNYCKATLDALTKGGVWKDDSQVKALHLLHGGYFRGGRVEIEIVTIGHGSDTESD